MKKIKLAVAMAIVGAAFAYNYTETEIELTDLQKENLEALAADVIRTDDRPNDGRFLCCNSLPGCCDYGDFEVDGDWAA